MLIKYFKDDLLNLIKNNREKHLKEFQEYQKVYLGEAKAWLNFKLNSLDEEDFSLDCFLTKPVSHVDEFDLIIKFLESTSNSSVELTPFDYKRFVLNVWE